MFEVQHLDHVALRVSDVAASANWYREILGMKPAFEGMWDGVPTMLAVGPSMIALFPTRDQDPDAVPSRLRMDHFAFRVDGRNFDLARRELPERGVPVEYADHQASRSIYFHDPDGHQVEITTYDPA